MKSHAALPVPVHLKDSFYRVFFSSRDEHNRSHVGWFDISLKAPFKVMEKSDLPVLKPGPLGTYDGQGIYASSAVKLDDALYLYTVGWNPGNPYPLFYSSIGLAISRDEGITFKKYVNSPIMARSAYDPCLVTSPFVMKEGNNWRMWYVSGVAWNIINGVPTSKYHIKYAESGDGIHWRRNGIVCIDNQDEKERNIARTCILKSEGNYHAWFSHNRGKGYRIDHAVSQDGIKWRRKKPRHGLKLSESGWDSEAMAYPWVVKYDDKFFMFYNGNSFGKDGIGLAVAQIRRP